jgi:exonuclease SbcC
MVNGVPYADANNAAKINAGLDIINTLSTHYGVSAPIFIDNREAVVELFPVNAQTISLVVSGQDKTLRVEV